MNREFNQSKPDKIYSTDITQINYGNKRAYLAAVKDLCTKEIVGKSVSSRIDLKLAFTAIDKALSSLTEEQKKELMIHSDQGVHYTNGLYRKKLEKNGVMQSMS